MPRKPVHAIRLEFDLSELEQTILTRFNKIDAILAELEKKLYCVEETLRRLSSSK